MEKVFREIIRTRVDDDGLVFLGEGVRAEPIRAQDEYEGVRLHVEARMGAARFPIQVDIGFGDAPVPAPPVRDPFLRWGNVGPGDPGDFRAPSHASPKGCAHRTDNGIR